MKPLKLEGKRFGRLVVLKREANKDGRTVWKCRCDCGKIHLTLGIPFNEACKRRGVHKPAMIRLTKTMSFEAAVARLKTNTRGRFR